MRLLIEPLLRLCLCVCLLVVSGFSHALCNGRIYNPITDTNWNNMFPITIAGVQANTGATDQPMHKEPPVCLCPGRLFGATIPGIGITYWEPVYVAEVAKDGGCLSTVGGIDSMSFAKNLNSTHNKQARDDRMQVHWYQYPVFSIVRLFADFGCLSTSGFSVGYLTELDPTHQNDQWGVVFSPEVVLFSSPIAYLACIPDVISSAFGYPIDPLFWCSGSQSPVYPLTGNSSIFDSSSPGNVQILAKFMYKQHRIGMLFQTIGPSAICFAHPNPIWTRSQYRLDPIWPVATFTDSINFGKPEALWSLIPPSNYPTHEDSAYLIWVAKQCCMRI